MPEQVEWLVVEVKIRARLGTGGNKEWPEERCLELAQRMADDAGGVLRDWWVATS